MLTVRVPSRNSALTPALTAFTERKELSPFRAGACHEDAIIEKPAYCKDGQFTVKGKIDLAYRDRDRVSVIDWKIGDDNGAEDSLQLLSYAMLAMSHFICTPDSLDLYRVHLGGFKVVHFRVSEADILRTRGRILQDLGRMQALEHYGRNAIVEAFTPCRQARICALCPYQGVCPKEYQP
ncbi:MAG: PD-(D/E)XK nuclease family protein [Spirochaetota bacterium]